MHIKFVQVQRSALKIGEKPNRIFDPTPITQVEYLKVSNDGVVGVTAAGEEMVDVHHRRHNESRFGGRNGISIGFTAYYHMMREKFGDHLYDGIAGENVIIEAEEPFTVDDIGRRVALENPQNGARIICSIEGVAAPCNEFSQFCAQQTLHGADLKAVLEFLNSGRRGFFLSILQAAAYPTIRAGDRIVLVEG